MIKIQNLTSYGWETAVRGMRNPMNSWDKSDSELCKGAAGFEDCHVSPLGACPRNEDFRQDVFCIGPNDLDLMRRLYNAGAEHRKYLRQITIAMDIVAPLYWWKEFDTYKVGTTANSCSTMHKIAAKEFTMDDFSCEHLYDNGHVEYECRGRTEYLDTLCKLLDTKDVLNLCRKKYLETGDKKYWWQMIQLLPSSYNQRRTVTMTGETAVAIIRQRKGHKLDEWQQMRKALLSLPYLAAITGEE